MSDCSKDADGKEEPLAVSRRRFMANATLGIGTVMGLGLAIPIGGALSPDTNAGTATWARLDAAGWRDLQASTTSAVQIDFEVTGKDAYLPTETARQSVWGIKVKDPQKFIRDRSDLFAPDGRNKLAYDIVSMGFALFSPLCPHLNCPYNYHPESGRFVCPCHGSEYNENGMHIAGPAARGLDPLPLRQYNGAAQVEWIRYRPTVPDRIVVSYIS